LLFSPLLGCQGQLSVYPHRRKACVGLGPEHLVSALALKLAHGLILLAVNPLLGPNPLPVFLGSRKGLVRAIEPIPRREGETVTSRPPNRAHHGEAFYSPF
jgi:hypothetical protein